MLREVEECVVLQQRVLEVITLDGVDFHVRSDSATPIYRTTTVGQLYFFIGSVADAVAIEIIIVKGYVAVITLNQPPTRGVILRRGQGQTSVIRKGIHRLHQTLAECNLTNHQ